MKTGCGVELICEAIIMLKEVIEERYIATPPANSANEPAIGTPSRPFTTKINDNTAALAITRSPRAGVFRCGSGCASFLQARRCSCPVADIGGIRIGEPDNWTSPCGHTLFPRESTNFWQMPTP